MSEIVEVCPICGSTEQKNYLVCKDYTVSSENFTVRQCQNCYFKFTSPRPSEKEIGPYYQSEEYISHSSSKKGIINKLYHGVRKKTLTNKLSLVNQLHSKGRLLDVGCGTGDFLKVCRENGWQTWGIEADPEARAKATATSQSEIQSNLLSAYKGKKFEVITLWHVLEHLHQLEASVEKIKQLLTADGILLVAVPNSESLDAKIYQSYWAAYDVPRHLYHFDQNSIKALFNKYSLKVLRVEPMKFDAFYISMLSTRYKYGQTNYLESFKNGLLSNWWAAKHNNNYSSITFVISQ